MEALGATSSVLTIIDATIRLVKFYQEVKNAKQEVQRLSDVLANYKISLDGLKKLLEGRNARHLENSRRLRSVLDNSRRQLDQVATRLEESLEAHRNKGKGGSKIAALKQKLGAGQKSLQWPFQSYEIGSIINNLQQDHNVFSSSLQIDLTSNVLDARQQAVLAKLPIADGAAFDSQANEHEPKCHPDTRGEVLANIYEWNKDPDARSIYWLRGMAGTGKSTISRTVAAHIHEEGIPIASYFFKRGEGDRGTASRFFPTITWQLAYRLPCLAKDIQDVLEADPSIINKGKKEQFEMLILKPLEACKDLLGLQNLITVVVDALDECDRDDDVTAIIRLFSLAKESLTSVRLRFFVTSRPEAPIRLGFKSIGDRFTDLALHEIPKPNIEIDIRTFLQWKLTQIKEEFNQTVSSSALPSQWPSAENGERLVRMAVPLFIFASTACRFISDLNYGDPEEQLEKVLDFEGRSGFSHLDAIYLHVLNRLLLERTDTGLKSRSEDDKAHIIANFREVVGVIVFLAEPLSILSLSRLLQIPHRKIEARLSGLHSVLNIPTDSSLPIKLLHLSFRDFLDSHKCRSEYYWDGLMEETLEDERLLYKHHFWVENEITHLKIASDCLSLLSMGNSIKKDICGLRLPEKPRSSLDPVQIDDCLPPAVQYACRHWVYHMKMSRDLLSDGGKVHVFLIDHFLHWLEALALIGRIKESATMVDDLLSLPIVSTLYFSPL